MHSLTKQSRGSCHVSDSCRWPYCIDIQRFRVVHDLSIGHLGAAAATNSASTATVLASVVATLAALANAATIGASTATPPRAITSVSVVVGGSVASGLRATRLNHNFSAIDRVRVGSHGSLVPLDRLELNKSAVLKVRSRLVMPYIDLKSSSHCDNRKSYLLTVDVEVGQLAACA